MLNLVKARNPLIGEWIAARRESRTTSNPVPLAVTRPSRSASATNNIGIASVCAACNMCTSIYPPTNKLVSTHQVSSQND
jgi:hypothetical protein